MEEKTNQKKQASEVYQLVTDRIIELLEKGVVPWKKMWTDSGIPQNLLTGKAYRGINLWLLAPLGYQQNYFATYKQIKQLGGTVRKGEQSHLVVFWKWIEQDDEKTGESVPKPFLRKYFVFNISQCDNIPSEKIPEVGNANDSIEECESLIANMPQCPVIKTGHGYPFYSSQEDYINMPLMKDFHSTESYYETLFHELIHSTGHRSRLNRSEVMGGAMFGSPAYSMEELTAEFGACYLKSMVGFKEPALENNAAYIQSWLEKLKNNKNFIVYSSVQAQHAIDFILNTVPQVVNESMQEVTNE